METKNNWNNLTFEWWAKREDKQDKPRYDLIPLDCLKRLAELYARWAKIYWDRNWEEWYKDEKYIEWMKASAFRHFIQWMNGETDEDHPMAVIWNIFWYEHLKNKQG